MAEITGPFRFKGSLGNIRVYWNSAAQKWVVATKGGANRDLILNNPAFARVRENMSEFSACGKWSSLVRKGLLAVDHLNWGYYMAEIVKLSKIIQKMDRMGVKGHRNIEPSKHKSLLTDLVFNQLHPFKKVLLRHPEVIADAQRKNITLNLSQFYPWYELGWTATYSCYRFTLAVAQLSDYTFVEEDGGYGPAHFGLETKKATVYSDWLMRNTDATDVSLTASFADDAIPPDDATVMVAVGIEFATRLSGDSISSGPRDGTMALVACF